MDNQKKVSISELKLMLEVEKTKLEVKKVHLSKYEYSYNRVMKIIEKILENKKHLKSFRDSQKTLGFTITKAHKKKPININADYHIDDDPEYYMKIEPFLVENEEQLEPIEKKLDVDIKEWENYSDMLLLGTTTIKGKVKEIENRINELNEKIRMSNDIQKDIPLIIKGEKQDNSKNSNKGITKRIREIIKEFKFHESEKYTDEICTEVCAILKKEGFEPVWRNVYTMLNKEGINNEMKKRK